MVELQRPKNKQDLRDAIIHCWDQLSLDFIQKCIRGLPNKMARAIDDATAKLGEAEESGSEETVDEDDDKSDRDDDEAGEVYLSEDSDDYNSENLSEDRSEDDPIDDCDDDTETEDEEISESEPSEIISKKVCRRNR